MHKIPFSSITRIIGLVAIFVTAMTLAACIASPVPAESPAADEETPTAIPQQEESVEPVDTKASEPTSDTTAQGSVPVQISLLDLDLTMPVTPMGWQVAVVDGIETTTWSVPDESLGWQINSAVPGGDGNMVIVGHQALGDALLAPLALDEVSPGQEIVVTDDAGTTFLYQISEVSDPIPVNDASADEEALATTYAAVDGDARLTLTTGWPDFTTTHRVFAVADLVGPAE